MTTKSNSPRASSPAQTIEGRSSVKWVAAAALLVCLAAVLWHFRSQSPPKPIDSSAEANNTNRGQFPQRSQRLETGGAQKQAATPTGESAGAAPAKQSAATSVSSPQPAPAEVAATVDPAMSSLARGLVGLGGTNGPITTEAAQAWLTNFQQLVQSGAGAVTALQAFLTQKQDVTFDLETARTLGYCSARLAAFDALRQIGGPDATAILDQTMRETTSPKEIATLAFDLNQLTQGQYREQALAKTRDTLAALSGSQSPKVDVAPLFEVFQHYGDPSVVADLEKAAGQWKYYAVSALANLPDDAGMASLVRMADPGANSGNRLIALEMLAQLSATSQTAREVLTSQITSQQIPQNFWPYLSSPLAGDQYYPVEGAITSYPTVQSWSDIKSTHINYGNQNFYQIPSDASLTAEGINQRLALVNALVAATTDTAALKTLFQVQTTLQNRLARLGAGSPPPNR